MKSKLSFHQSSRAFTSALGHTPTERPDDLYIPFEESLLGNKPSSPKASVLAATNNTLPWGAARTPQRPIQPKSPTRYNSGTCRAVYPESFEPEIQLRDRSYSSGGAQPMFSHLHSGPHIFPVGLGRRIQAPRSAVGQETQEDAAMITEARDADEVVDVLVRSRSEVTGVPLVEVLKPQARRKPKAGRPLSNDDSSEKSQSSKQTRHPKTTDAHSATLRKPEPWQAQKHALQRKFGQQGWSPRKRLSPDALEGIRALHAQYPEKFTTPVLADQFKISPEAIRRILRSKWRPDEVEETSRRRRWDKRGESIWRQMVELGVKPPKRWREMGVTKTNTVHGVDRNTRRHHEKAMGKGDETTTARDHGAEQSPNSGTVARLEPDDLLEERIL